MIINRIFDSFRKDAPEIERTKVSGDFIEKSVMSYLDEHDATGDRFPLDATYYTTSSEDMNTIIEGNQVDRNSYTRTKYDCENFALSFMSTVQKERGINSVGMVIDWDGTHAYNIIVYKSGNVKLYEPQTDRFITPGSKQKYSFDSVSIII